jgi:hypothetical protein
MFEEFWPEQEEQQENGFMVGYVFLGTDKVNE